MLIVGYDDNRSAFLVMNSWGTDSWNTRHNDPRNDAKPGFCWISYNIIEDHCFEAFIANEKQSYYSLSAADLYSSNAGVRSTENKQETVKKEALSPDSIPFFITNRYNQYDNIRLIPLNIDKDKGDATVAVYKIENDNPSLYTVFHTKVNETVKFEVDNKTIDFHLLYIRPWRDYAFGLFHGADALFYRIKIQ